MAENQQCLDVVDGGCVSRSAYTTQSEENFYKHGTISAFPLSGTVGIFSEPINDELIARVAPVLLHSTDFRSIAYDVLGLSYNLIDAESAPLRNTPQFIYQLLRLGVERKRINTPKELKIVLEKACCNGSDLVDTSCVSYLASLEGKHTDMTQVCSTVSRFISPENYEVLFVGYFGLTFYEIKQQQPQLMDHNTVIIRLLSLWRRRNPGRNSAGHLIQTLEDRARSYAEAVCMESGDANGGMEGPTKKRRCVSPYDEFLDAVKQEIEKSQCDANLTPYINLTYGLPTLESLRIQLKDLYFDQHHILNPLPWVSSIRGCILNDVFITLHVDREGEKRTVISMNNLFTQQHKGSEPPVKKILLHGEAGSGKTTLIAKIALDWATGQTNIQQLLEFTVVFVVEAGRVKEGETLNEYIIRECLPNMAKQIEDVEQELCYENVLILIDGYDERRDQKDFLQDLIERKTSLLNATIVLTSRYGAAQNIRHNFNFQAGIRGFNQDDIKRFVSKYADQKTEKNFLDLHVTNHPFIDTLANPLYLWMFVLLGEDYYRDIDTFTRTDFYRQSILGITDKAKHKLCLNSETSHKEIEEAINKLCLYAYQCVKEDTLQICNVSSINNFMLKLGLFNEVVSRSGIQDKKVYVFAHRTVIEFLAAKHIVNKGRADEEGIVQRLLELPEVRNEHRRKASMVLLFVAGLLKESERVIKEMIHQLVPAVGCYVDRHVDHLGLSLLCELSGAQWNTAELLHCRTHRELVIDSSCTPYCIRGLEKLSQTKPFKQVKFVDYCHFPTSEIKTTACYIELCRMDVILALTSRLDVNCLVNLRIDDVTLLVDGCSDVISAISRYSNLQELSVDDITLEGNADSVRLPALDSLPHIKTLCITGPATPVALFTNMYWTRAEEIEMRRVDPSNEDIEMIAHNASQCGPPRRLMLKHLCNNGTARLMESLTRTNCVETLQELEVWCLDDVDCSAVESFVSRCKKLKKFLWRNRVVLQDISQGTEFDVSVDAMTSLWKSLVNKHLETVVVQDFSKQWDEDFLTYNSMLLSVLSSLSDTERQGIRWSKIHVIPAHHHAAPVCEALCRDVHSLLPGVQEVSSWRDDNWWRTSLVPL